MSAKRKAAPKKTTKNTDKTKKPSKNHTTIYASLKESLSWRKSKPGEAFLDAVIDHLEEWIKDDENTDIYSFIHYLGVPSKTYFEWLHKYPKLKVAHTTALEMLGVRRQRHAEYRKYAANPEVIRSTLYKYHPIWKAVHDEEKAFKKDLKHDIEENQRPVHIYMDGVKVEGKEEDT